MAEPLIGITVGRRDAPSSAGGEPGYHLPETYGNAVVRAGGVPLLLPPESVALAGRALDAVDGLVLSGGGDVDPAAYGGSPHEAVYGVDAKRDAFEIAVARHAVARRIPTLAICRGLQILNVALGGTLIEDIPSEVGTEVGHSSKGRHVYERSQVVTVEPDTRLAAVLGHGDVKVNSIHHQAVRAVAPPLRVVARAPDGVIEALEHEDPAWEHWAVQWHPEYLAVQDDGALALFHALVEAAGREYPR